jgi:hypothetical protein
VLEGIAEEIACEARKGSFDRNPRLQNWVVCGKCGCRAKRYIEYLKAGEFEVGQVEHVLVSYPGYYYLCAQETETVTPIFITAKCQRCGSEKKMTDPALTVEYLQSFAKRKETVRLCV